MGYPSCSDPLPHNSPRNSPRNSRCYSAPPPQQSPPRSPPTETPLNINLLPPRPLEEDPPLYIITENKLNCYILENMIGTAFGTPVYKAFLHPFGCDPLTIPVVLRPVNHQIDHYYESVAQINKNRLVDHPGILAVKEEVNVGGRLWVVSEFAGRSLRLIYPNGAPLQVIANCLFSALHSLVSVHEKKLVHGDVHAGNMFIQEEDPSLCKLGFAATVYECLPVEKSQEDLLNLAYICYWGDAPEVASKGQVRYRTESSDVWQLGISGLELALGNIWVRDRKEFDDIVRYATTEWDFGVFKNIDFKRFLNDCLQIEPELRPKSQQLLQHDFFLNNWLGPTQ